MGLTIQLHMLETCWKLVYLDALDITGVTRYQQNAPAIGIKLNTSNLVSESGRVEP